MTTAQPFLIIIGFILLWIFCMFLIAVISGWRKTAKVYSDKPAEKYDCKYFVTAKINRARYKNCLTFGKNETGIMIGVFFFFRPFHPTLYIPKRDITVGETFGLLLKWKPLTLKESGVTVFVPERLAVWLLDLNA